MTFFHAHVLISCHSFSLTILHVCGIIQSSTVNQSTLVLDPLAPRSAMSTSWIGVFLEGVRSTTYASSEQTKKTTMIIGAVVLVAIMSCWLIPIRSRRQRYIPGVPIFGGSNPTSIKKSRVRFVHDSMSMLLQGYREVSCGDRPGTRGEQTLMDLWIDSRGSLLRPDQTWREIDAPG